MNILIAGASGFIGHALLRALQQEHQVTALGRNKAHLWREFSSDMLCCSWDELCTLDAAQFDVVINLCGSNIGARRWNVSIKQQLIDSRVSTCETLIGWLIKQQAKPHFMCANAVGIYGLQQRDDLTSFDEDSLIDYHTPRDFLNEIGIRWQMALQPAIDYGMPVTSTRFGVVLQKGQGMLQKLLPSFTLGLGSIIGDGQQTLSWIHIEDIVAGIQFLLRNPTLTGAVNLTAPNPVSQLQFARVLAQCLHRPLFLHMPARVIHWLFGEMGDCLLLQGQRVVPKRLLAAGYTFKYPDLVSALQQEFGR